MAVIDNEHYGETGMQRTHTSAGVDLAGIALQSGFREAATVRNANELNPAVSLLGRAIGPVLVVLKVSTTKDPLVLPSWDGPYTSKCASARPCSVRRARHKRHSGRNPMSNLPRFQMLAARK